MDHNHLIIANALYQAHIKIFLMVKITVSFIPYLDLAFIPYHEEFAPNESRSQFTGGDAFHVDELFFASSNILRSSSKSK